MPSTRKKRALSQTPDKPPSKRIKTQADADNLRRSRRLRGLTATPPRELLDLPPEVFQHILHFVVQDIKGALRARCVSRELAQLSTHHARSLLRQITRELNFPGFFKQEIDSEIFWSKALEKEEHLLKLKRTQPWRCRLIAAKAFSHRHRHSSPSPFFDMIRKVTESIISYLQYRTPDTVALVAKRVTALPCLYMMPQKFKRVIVDPLPPTDITWSTINQACICVSARMGHYDMYNHFQALEPTPFRGIHTYFGSPIWAAASFGQHNFLRQLRIDGVNFYPGIDYGIFTPLMAARARKNDNHKQSALVLLDSMISGGQIHLEDLRTSLIYARETRFLPLFRLLTEPTVRGLIRIELENVLHLESGEDANQLTKLLITRGVDPNTRALLDLLEISSPEKLPTPLQDAVNNGKRARMDLLLAHGADPNMVTSADGLSPLEVALRQRSPDVVDALLRHGAAKYAVANPTNNGGFNILTHPDAWAHPPTWDVCLSHFDTSEPLSPDSPNGPRLYRTINDYAHAYAALLEAAGRGRRDLVLRLMDRDVSIHGRWDPPLPPFPSPRRWMATDPPPPLPRRHVMLAPPALQAALLAGDQAMVTFLLGHGAVWNYPYDYLLREPGESAMDVEKRVARVRARACVRDSEEEEREREARRRERETLRVAMRAANASPN